MTDRVIKFNAWDEKTKRMYLWDDIESIERDRIWLRRSKQFVSFVKLLQFVGLKDKNGKDFKEGDIITKNGTWHGIIEYESGAFFANGKGCHFQISICVKEYTILGNKYQNPELLNKTKRR